MLARLLIAVCCFALALSPPLLSQPNGSGAAFAQKKRNQKKAKEPPKKKVKVSGTIRRVQPPNLLQVVTLLSGYPELLSLNCRLHLELAVLD